MPQSESQLLLICAMLVNALHRPIFLLLIAIATGTSSAETQLLPVQQQARIEKYRALLAFWAAQPAIIDATRKANRNPHTMSNIAWDRLDEQDPLVLKPGNSSIAKQLEAWEKDVYIIKLNLRDKQGNLIAYSARSGKPLLFNNSNRSPFINGIKGSWAAEEIKPDPSTQQNAVQIATPVMDGNHAIGVLQSAVIIE